MIFRNGPSRWLFLFLVVLSIIFIVLDSRSKEFRESKSIAATVVAPLQWLVNLPSQFAEEASDVLVSRASLVAENNLLRNESLLLEEKTLLNASLETENRRLRVLLNAKDRVAANVQLTELIGVSPDPFRHEIVINKGAEEGVFIGQPILDAKGVMGVAMSVSPVTSRVLLVTDARSAIPIEVLRTGFRAIVLGMGATDTLKLDHIPNTADIRVGDLLVTSGIGGAFPRGYPVAEIVEFSEDPGRAFALTLAKPVAELDTSRYLLLVEKSQDGVELKNE